MKTIYLAAIGAMSGVALSYFFDFLYEKFSRQKKIIKKSQDRAKLYYREFEPVLINVKYIFPKDIRRTESFIKRAIANRIAQELMNRSNEFIEFETFEIINNDKAEVITVARFYPNMIKKDSD